MLTQPLLGLRPHFRSPTNLPTPHKHPHHPMTKHSASRSLNGSTYGLAPSHNTPTVPLHPILGRNLLRIVEQKSFLYTLQESKIYTSAR